MDATSSRWQAITDSEFPWERDALAFVRDRLPDHDPYRVWSNFEFIADDGSINEVDLLVLTPKGLCLVEIKSRPGIEQLDVFSLGAIAFHLFAGRPPASSFGRGLAIWPRGPELLSTLQVLRAKSHLGGAER